MFSIRFGVPDMINFWERLKSEVESKTANKEDQKLYKRLVKTLKLLRSNPRHNSLNSHEITILSDRYGRKVWESYIENNKPRALRIYWVYYPPGSITIISLQPHPDESKHSYEKIVLSSTD